MLKHKKEEFKYKKKNVLDLIILTSRKRDEVYRFNYHYLLSLK